MITSTAKIRIILINCLVFEANKNIYIFLNKKNICDPGPWGHKDTFFKTEIYESSES